MLVKIQMVFIICNPLVFLNDLSLNIKIRKILLSYPKEKRRGTQDRSSLFFLFNPFLPIALKHLSYLTQVKNWILEYPVQAISDLLLNNL